MKAIIIKENGGVESLVLTEVPMPEIKPDEVLVRVKAISVNPVDTAVRQNKQALFKIMQLKAEQDYYIPGWDISGTVIKAGSNATELEGKDVFGMVNFPGQGRAYAEYAAAPTAHLAIKPPNIPHQEAAAATLAALTAWQALVTYGKINKGNKVIIHAASGGVGHYAVQIANYFGAYVTGIASGRNRDFVLGLGADRFIDYTAEHFEEVFHDADLVVDSINNRDSLIRSMKALKNGGRLVSIKAYFDEETIAIAREKQLYHERILVSSNGEDMKQIAVLLGNRTIKSHVSRTFTFEDMAKAHLEIETGRTRGKIVVSV